MFLNSKEVLETITQGKDRAVAQQHGVDLTVMMIRSCEGGEISKEKSSIKEGRALRTFNRNGKNFYDLFEPGVYEVRFEQGIKVPANVKGNIIHRSSVLRNGSIILSGEYDPGFETEHMGAFMFVFAPISIEVGSRVAQLVMAEVKEGAPEYDGQFKGK